MGARATIRIIHPTSDTPIHLYTHWNGHNTPYAVADGLKRCFDTGRIHDYQYATRIIFDTFTGLTGDDTGFGICIGDEGQPGDVEYHTITIEWAYDERDYVGEPTVLLNSMGMKFLAHQFIDRMGDEDFVTTLNGAHLRRSLMPQ